MSLSENGGEQVKGQFIRCHAEIKQTMAQTFLTFANDSDEVRHEWVKYTKKIDRKVEDALRATVKKSLQELSRLLNGDKKTEVRSPYPPFPLEVTKSIDQVISGYKYEGSLGGVWGLRWHEFVGRRLSHGRIHMCPPLP